VDRRWSVFDLVGDLPHGDRLVTLLQEKFTGGIENLASNFFFFALPSFFGTHDDWFLSLVGCGWALGGSLLRPPALSHYPSEKFKIKNHKLLVPPLFAPYNRPHG